MTDPADDLLAEQTPVVAEVARRIIAQITQVYPDAVVTVDGGDIGFGTTTGYRGLSFVVTPHKGHVTLGIAHGASLPDPAGLLEGSGKVHRHVKLRTPEDADRPELVALLEARAATAEN